MKKFKCTYIISVMILSIIVMIFFIEHQRLVYAASGLLWVGLVLEIAIKEKMPEEVLGIRKGWTRMLLFGVMGLSNGFSLFRGVNQIIEYGVAKELNMISFITAPLMLISFSTGAENLYIYEGGIVSDRSIFEFSKIESVKWEMEDDLAKLSFEYEGRKFSVDIPSQKLDQVNEVLLREGLLVDDGVLDDE